MTNVMGVNAVLGMDWIHLSGEPKERAQQKGSHRKALGARYSVSLENGGVAVYGAATPLQEKLNTRTISGAAWLAKAFEKTSGAVLIKELEGGLAWVCAVYRGLPMARGDQVVRQDKLMQTIDDLMIAHEKAEFAFIVDEREPGRLGGAMGRDLSCQPNALVALLKGTVPAQCRLSAEHRVSPAVVLLALLAAAASSAFAWWQYTLHQEREAERRRLAAVPPPKPEEIYAKKFSAYFGGKPHYRATELAGFLYRQIRARELIQDGWLFQSVACEAAKRECTMEFKRGALAGPLMLDADSTFRIDYTIDTAKVHFKIDIPDLRPPDPAQPAALLHLFPTAVLLKEIAPAMRVFGDLGFQAGMNFPAPISAVPVAGSPIEVQQGAWTIAGSMGMFDLISKLPESLYASALQVTLSERGMVFTIAGEYWTAKGALPPAATRLASPAAAASPMRAPANPG